MRRFALLMIATIVLACARDAMADGMQGYADPTTGRVLTGPPEGARPATRSVVAPAAPVASPTPVAAPGGGMMMRTDDMEFEVTGSVDDTGHAAAACDRKPSETDAGSR